MNTQYLFCDRPFADSEVLPSDKGLRIPSHGSHMFGYALLPGGAPSAKHPCAVMLHGLPGYTTNHDLAQALRRMGCVVLNPFYRGAWGSEGYFTLSGMVGDVISTVRWAQSDAAEEYGIDPEQLYLVGISMGGWAALSAISQLPELQGAVAIAPADGAFIARERPDMLRLASRKYGCLKLQSEDALVTDAAQHPEDLSLSHITGKLHAVRLLLIGGTLDTAVPPDAVLLPLWEELSRQKAADKTLLMLDAGHSFANCRHQLIREVGQWIAAHTR